MIIKRWNGTAFAEEYAKTKASLLYANDGTTALFDANQKLKAQYMPDVVFDSLYPYGTLGPVGENYGIKGFIAHAYHDATFIDFRSPNGYYAVLGATGTITRITTAELITLYISSVDYPYYVKFDLNLADSEANPTPASVVVEKGDWIFISKITGTGTVGDPLHCYINVVNSTVEFSTSSTPGIVKLFSDTSQAVTANEVSSTASRTYGIQNNGSGQLVVNVPWEDTTYDLMTSSTLGLGKLFSDTEQSVAAEAVSSTASRTYGIQKNASGQLVVNVPWSDTNTTYAQANASTLGLVKLVDATTQTTTPNAVTTTASRSYSVQLNASGQMVVNVPWTDTNTTYVAATSAVLGLSKLGSDTEQSVAANAVSSTASRTYAIQHNASDQMVVNVPWTDTNTTYTAGANGGLTLDSTAFRMTHPLYVQTATPTPTAAMVGAIWFDIN